MKKILLPFILTMFLPSCALNTKSGSATLDPDAETVRAVSDLIRVVLAEK